MPLDRRGHLGARASAPQLLVTFDDRPVTAEGTREYSVPAANASRPAWSPGCAGLRPQLLVTFDDRAVPRRALANIPCPLPMPLDQRGHLGARASAPQLLVTFDDRAVPRRALANIPCPLPMHLDRRGHWVRGPPARSFWSHSMTGQCRGGHSRIFRARCQCLSTSVVTGCAGLRPAAFGHIR
jgi:hypothetical protein